MPQQDHSDYIDFLRRKIKLAAVTGLEVAEERINPILKPHERDIVQWAVRGGNRGIFASFGLGKSIMQVEYLRNIHESIRDGKLSPEGFVATSLDEASVLRSFGSKTYQEFLPAFAPVEFKLVSTATPSPNRYKELIHYAGYLGIMDTGQALAQPLTSKVLTPAGWSAMGDIKMGDKVIARNGKPTLVIGVYPQGERDIFNVKFSDGTSTRCTAEHLWLTRTQYQRNAAAKFEKRNPSADSSHYWTIKQTSDISETLACNSTGSKNHQVPLVEPVAFKESAVNADPYLVGFLLGDGNLRKTSVNFSTADAWIVTHIEQIVGPLGLSVRKNTHERADGQPNYDYSISAGHAGKTGRGHESNAVLSGLRSYGLLGKRAWEKRIPDLHLFNTAAVRLATLQGLMDADGTVSADGTVRLTTTSAGMAEDVIFIVQSFGGTAEVFQQQGRTPKGEAGRIQHRVTIRLPNGINPFRLPRKANSVRSRVKYEPKRYIISVEPDGREEAQCIAVADDEHLYVTDSFIVTHNTRFFQRDSEKAGNLTLYPHKEQEFWLWVSSWAVFIQKPSDLGYSDEGYELPPLDVRYHEVPSDYSKAGADKQGQNLMFPDLAMGLQAASREKRDSMDSRIAKAREIIDESPDDHYVVWHDLEDERHAIQKAIPDVVSVWGSQDLDEREERIMGFGNGEFSRLSTKPIIAGSGCNFQRHCHREIFSGIGFKFNDFIQAIHRVQRFQQPHPVRIDIIYSEGEREILRTLQQKWQQHNEMVKKMTDIIKQYGLADSVRASTLARTIGVERIQVDGELFSVANNDCVIEARLQPDNSVDEIITSIPFANHYEYTPKYEDFGHTENNGQFWEQMDFLTPELLRILKPGRMYCCHVKDRILFGNVTGAGVPTVSPFHCEAILHARKHGFDYMGMITVNTDVVRENNQTYRLGWSEQCKDGTKMGVGSPEYVLLFRKPQTDRTKGYADVPVKKSKDDYSRSRWQVDAHAFWRSSGNRQLTAEEMAAYGPEKLAKLFTEYSLENIYDYEFHYRIGEELDERGALPSVFMSLAPGSHHPDIWHDVQRMLTLNGEQSRRNVEQHVCLARGSLVLTRRGYIEIQDVKVGDMVLTHKGRWRTVQVVANTGVRPVVDLRAQGVAALTLTPEHKVWARKTDWVRERDGAERSAPEWIRADESVGGYVNQKLPPIEDCDLSGTELWLVGRWLADGHVGTRDDFHVSIGPEKIDEFERMAGMYIGTRRKGTAVQVRLKGMSDGVVAALQQCGRCAANKQVPAHLLGLPTDKARALLEGYLSGDGHLVQERGTWQAASVSRALLLGISLLAQRVHGAVASMHAGRAAGTSEIQGRTVQTQQEWYLSFDIDGKRRKRPFLLDDGAWKKVRNVDPAGEAETWCLRVEEDASFSAEGCVVANCPLQFDIVDRLIERYSNPGETIYDPFHGLGTVSYRAIKLGRKGKGSELNPAYFLDSIHYLKSAEKEATMPTLFDFEDIERKAA